MEKLVEGGCFRCTKKRRIWYNIPRSNEQCGCKNRQNDCLQTDLSIFADIGRMPGNGMEGECPESSGHCGDKRGREEGTVPEQWGDLYMSRKLLFISKYPEIVKEFLDAMGGKEMEIDTASNGIDAVAKLKKTEYQVIVTGLSMDGYNGEQLITYLNKNHPNTVCIIYTTTISLAQLLFFINERNVFRVFLRPVNFRNEFLEALEEAFDYYDIRVKDKEEESERRLEMEEKKKAMVELERKLGIQKEARNGMARYAKELMALSLAEYAGKLDAEQVSALKQLEWEAVDLCCGQEKNAMEQLAEAEMTARKVSEFTETQI